MSKRSVTVVGLLALAACADASLGKPLGCEDLNPLELSGNWTITGDGKRGECASTGLDGDLELDVASFYVSAQPQADEDGSSSSSKAEHEADGFVDRILAAPVKLSSNPRVGGVTFHGTGGGRERCAVRFSICEPLPDIELGDRVCDELPTRDRARYEFEGYMQDTDRVTGTFTGTGPGPCVAEGEFEVVRR